MCGICGFIGKGNRDILQQMTAAIKHRGPDEAGFFVKEPIFLGHSRLSIIDVAGGKQPIFNENKTVVVIFNGEIYNFKELKKGLKERGHKFKTNTDTEVLVHLYEEKGEGFLNELNGMFAIALCDLKNKKLILARDRFGQKPLYYAFLNDSLVFASELKAILKYPKLKKEIDLNSLAKYLHYEYIPSPQTIFKDIYKLEAGCYLVFSHNNLEKKKYWELGFAKGGSPNPKQSDVLTILEREMERAVKIRLMADVPLGVFLSGGIDSSAIAYFAQKNSTSKIKTFSIGFEEKSFDETRFAKKAADFLHTEHHHKTLTAGDSLNLIPKIADILDEPLADASIIPTYLLSCFTKEKVKVALTGDGADELFCGYYTFQAHQLDKAYNKIPKLLRKQVIEKAVNSLPVSLNNFSFDFKAKKFVSCSNEISEIKDQIWLSSFKPDDLPVLLADTGAVPSSEALFENILGPLNTCKGECLANRLSLLYLKNYLQDDILTKTDRASMACGLETRSPFLDYILAQYIINLPGNFKIKGLKTKYIFKKLMQNKLPKEIVYRKKKGFGMPLGFWLQNELKDLSLDLLSENKIKQQGLFSSVFVQQLLKEHLNNKKDNRKTLWTLLVFQMWYDKWFK